MVNFLNLLLKEENRVHNFQITKNKEITNTTIEHNAKKERRMK